MLKVSLVGKGKVDDRLRRSFDRIEQIANTAPSAYCINQDGRFIELSRPSGEFRNQNRRKDRDKDRPEAVIV